MIPVTQQRRDDDEGDCLMAAAASILEIPLASLPAITRENESQWWNIFVDAMHQRGFKIIEAANSPALAPHGYAIAVGLAPRNQGVENHAVVALDGQVVHDPHPTHTGVERIDYWLIFVPLARRPAQVSPTSTGEEQLL
jgi:hypothetical protein